jgi:hypothetical protein
MLGLGWSSFEPDQGEEMVEDQDSAYVLPYMIEKRSGAAQSQIVRLLQVAYSYM